MTAVYDYYKLRHPEEGVVSGFEYKTVPHITLKSIANNEPPSQETLYDQPLMDNKKVRITGPFTVESTPCPIVRSLSELKDTTEPDILVSHSGETVNQSELREEFLASGIRGKNGQKIEFSRVEPVAGTKWIQAEAETIDKDPKKAVIYFGSNNVPIDARTVSSVLTEVEGMRPQPKIVVFVGFQFDPEASKDIDETNWPGKTLLKVQANTDLMTKDLKKKRSNSDSFWLIGQPDVELRKIADGKNSGKYVVSIKGFDYYNTQTGIVESGDTRKIAMWMIDTNFDDRSIFPKQVFFPMASENKGWKKLIKTLKVPIDEINLSEAYNRTESLPFNASPHTKIAIKIVDDRDIETLKIMEVD